MQKKNIPQLILLGILALLIAYGILVLIGVLMHTFTHPLTSLQASGRIEGKEYHASTKIMGRIEALYVKEGQDVQKGQAIASIQSPQLIAQKEQAEAQVRKATAHFTLAQTDHTRYCRLLKEHAVSQSEYDVIENKYKVAQEELIFAQKELDRLNEDLKDTLIIAPVPGKIVTTIMEQGEVIAQGTPVVTIINMDRLYLKIFLPTEQVGKVKIGDEAYVFADAFPHEPVLAKVTSIAEKAEFTPKNVETKSQRAKLVFEVKLDIQENPEYKIKPGMPAETIIRIDKDTPWKELLKHR